jgi:DNA-binding response OmpR family regulator
MRVIIVLDEPLIAMSLAAELKLAGHEVIWPSGDAAEALLLARDHQPDIALIDAGLDGAMGAVELARALQVQCDVPVLFLTTEPDLTNENADAALGMISLPFDPSEIPKTIEAAREVMQGGSPSPRTVPHSLQLFPVN